jgi:two-component system CitB family response regulator
VIRTIVVDDDFRVAALHRAYAERVPGFSVVGEARTGADALALVDRVKPDLVLLDIYLPDISGLDVLRALREEGRPPLDVIAITAARDVQTLRAAMTGGVVYYLAKPFRYAAFEEKLQSFAAVRTRMARLREADQTEIDRIFSLLRSSGPTAALPKGLSDTTLEVVVSVLLEYRSGLTAQAVAETTGISRVTARRYLDHLCGLGRAEVTLRYGNVGRPEHRYRLVS